MARILLAVDFEIEARWLEDLIRGGHDIVDRVTGADALTQRVLELRPDLALVQAGPETLTPTSLRACDASGARTVAVTADELERRHAAALGIVDRADAAQSWARIERALAETGRGGSDPEARPGRGPDGPAAAPGASGAPGSARRRADREHGGASPGGTAANEPLDRQAGDGLGAASQSASGAARVRSGNERGAAPQHTRGAAWVRSGDGRSAASLDGSAAAPMPGGLGQDALPLDGSGAARMPGGPGRDAVSLGGHSAAGSPGGRPHGTGFLGTPDRRGADSPRRDVSQAARPGFGGEGASSDAGLTRGAADNAPGSDSVETLLGPPTLSRRELRSRQREESRAGRGSGRGKRGAGDRASDGAGEADGPAAERTGPDATSTRPRRWALGGASARRTRPDARRGDDKAAVGDLPRTTNAPTTAAGRTATRRADPLLAAGASEAAATSSRVSPPLRGAAPGTGTAAPASFAPALPRGDRRGRRRGATGGTAPALARDGADTRTALGRVVAVWGAHGAPGATTVATALAGAAAADGQRVLLVDADSYGGSIAAVLGITDEAPGFAAACRLAGAESLTTAELDRVSSPSGTAAPFRVLSGIVNPGRWPELGRERVATALDVCREAADLTIVDVGFNLETDEELLSDVGAPRRNAATLTVLDAADIVVTVVEASPVGIPRFLRARPTLLDRLGPQARIHTVANRVRATNGADAGRQVRDALRRFGGIDEVRLLPDDARSCDKALGLGLPVTEAAPRSPLARQLRDLAARLQ